MVIYDKTQKLVSLYRWGTWPVADTASDSHIVPGGGYSGTAQTLKGGWDFITNIINNSILPNISLLV